MTSADEGSTVVKVMTWNMARNTTARATAVHSAGWDYLANADPDLAFLQETTVPNWARERWTIVAPTVRYWGSAVIARPSFALRDFAGPLTSRLERHGYIAWASLTLDSANQLTLGSIHAPVAVASADDLEGRDAAEVTRPLHQAQGRGPYRTDAAYAISRDRIGASRFLVAGDWNISRLWDSRRRITECHEFFDRASAAGWVECTRSDPELHTWHRKPDPPYQMDHAFADPATAALIRSVNVDPEPAATLGLSDHAPLVFEVAL